jgi:aryl-alcohol dehydrogenase-like predicted oxidoreductase
VTAHSNPAVRTGAGLLGAAEKPAQCPHPVTVTESGDPHVAEILRAIARQHEATIAQIALVWQLHRSPASLPIPGTTSVHHLRENLAAGTICLTPAKVQAITDIVPES